MPSRSRWILKTEPETFSYDDLERAGSTTWDGVRNYQARIHLRAMRVGDECLIYHSGGPRELVGIARVTKAAYPDPTTDDERWIAVDLEPLERLKKPVGLAAIKADAELAELGLVRHTRLSVMPVDAAQWKRLLLHARGGVKVV